MHGTVLALLLGELLDLRFGNAQVVQPLHAYFLPVHSRRVFFT